LSYRTRLVGNIDIEQEAVSIEVNPEHFSSLDTLVDDYGWLGKGFKSILENPHISGILSDNGVESLGLDENGVHGLEKISQPEREIIELLLTRQYGRSQKLFEAAKSEELENYDNVSWGVIKGVTMGAAVGGVLDIAGLEGTVYQLIARLGPGALESSGIAHQVLAERGEKSLEELTLYGKGKRFLRELGIDSKEIIKRVPGGFYSAVNVGGWADRLLRRNKTQQEGTLETNTQVWSEAQENAPYKGLIGIAILKSTESYIPRALYTPLESLAVFWVNTGNNVQGAWAVAKDIYKNSPDYTASKVKKGANTIKELLSDPFQLANAWVAVIFLSGEVVARSYGFKPEEAFGNLGAGLESAFLSMDTAFAAQFAKPIAYTQVVTMPKIDVSTPRLMDLARKYKSEELLNRLSDDTKGPVQSMKYSISRLLNTNGVFLTSYDVAHVIGSYVHSGISTIGNLANRNNTRN